MRNKIDFGIDLGTTNSAIARMVNGQPITIKSETLKDTFPSCVHFTKRRDILVGDRAFNQMKTDSARALKTFTAGNTNTFIEFKRTMGTSHAYQSSNMERSFNSDELSAEVLKTLKSASVDENISSIVITVPAKFLNPQLEATINAAKMVGFKQIQLLQEPVAAATAYGLNSKKKDGYWLVFDFGGGTFDAALVKAEEGVLSVKDTEGNNWLGGKNLDEAIVDNIIIPHLQETFAIDFVVNDPLKKELLRAALKFYAEETKNELSFKDKTHILTQLGDLPFDDENGEQPEIDVEITQNDLEVIFRPIFQETIDIAKDLLKRNNLKGSNLDALILVGGPTYSPILRKMLKEQITEKVNTSVNPMTVVAQGAALFASTISVSEEVKDAKRDKTKLQFDVKYEATTVELTEMINIKLLKEKTIGDVPEKIFVELVRFDNGWTSGKKLVKEKATIIDDILLVEDRSNSFEILAYDEQGNKLESEPNQFSILQGIGGLDSMQTLPYHIGIGRYFETEEKDLFFPALGLEKNKKVPAVGVINGLKTRTEIRPGMKKDMIRIPLYQGDYNAGGTNPLLNNIISEVIITGETLPGLLPKGSDVDITIKVDRSQIMQFSAYFPLLNHTEELQVDIKSTKPPTEQELSNQIKSARSSADRLNTFEIIQQLDNLDAQLQNEKGSADGKMKILNDLRKELLKLDSAEKTAEWPKVEQELKDAFYELEDLVEKIKTHGAIENLNMDKVDAIVEDFKLAVEQTVKDKNITEAKKLIDRIGHTDFDLRSIVTGNAMDLEYLQHIDSYFNEYHWKDASKARQLVNQGLQLGVAGNTTAIRPLIYEIISLLPDDEKPKDTLK